MLFGNLTEENTKENRVCSFQCSVFGFQVSVCLRWGRLTMAVGVVEELSASPVVGCGLSEKWAGAAGGKLLVRRGVSSGSSSCPTACATAVCVAADDADADCREGVIEGCGRNKAQRTRNGQKGVRCACDANEAAASQFLRICVAGQSQPSVRRCVMNQSRCISLATDTGVSGIVMYNSLCYRGLRCG